MSQEELKVNEEKKADSTAKLVPKRLPSLELPVMLDGIALGVTGVKLSAKHPEPKVDCKHCMGKGTCTIPCSECEATGEVGASDTLVLTMTPCKACKGKGKCLIYCEHCTTDYKFDYSLPPGFPYKKGKDFLVDGGHAVIHVTAVASTNEPHFTRMEGDHQHHLRMKAKISMAQAIGGEKFELKIPHPDGKRFVQFASEEGKAYPHLSTRRVKGLGLPKYIEGSTASASVESGDCIIVFEVQWPSAAFFEQHRDKFAGVFPHSKKNKAADV